MQTTFTYRQDGCLYTAHIWTDRAEAVEQARHLSSRTTMPHVAQELGDVGWVCVQTKPTLWVDACNAILKAPTQLLRYLQWRQASRDYKALLEREYSQGLGLVCDSWVKLNPLQLAEPKKTDYWEAALSLVYLLDNPEGSLSLEEGVQLLFEQGFKQEAPEGKARSISRNLKAWWDKHVAPATQAAA